MSRLEVTFDESVAIARLNDAQRRNVIFPPLVDELETVFDKIEDNDAINSVVITGNGSVFCAGADLADLEAASKGDTDGLKRIYQGFLRVADCPLPTIAAVNGPAVGAGMNLALACDVGIAAQSAVLDTRLTDLGLHPGGGHTWMLNRAIGWQASTAMLLLGQKLSGEQAEQWNLARVCFGDDELLSKTIEIAKRSKNTPQQLLERSKQSMRNSVSENDHNQAVDFEHEHQIWSMHQGELLDFLRKMQTKISSK